MAETFRVVAQADTAYRSDINNLSDYYVRNSSGQMLPLSTIVSFTGYRKCAADIALQSFRTAEINGGSKPGYSCGRCH